MAELRIAEDRNGLLVATDRTSKFAYVELPEKDTMRIAAEFLQNLISFVPYKIHIVPADNGTHFIDLAGES